MSRLGNRTEICWIQEIVKISTTMMMIQQEMGTWSTMQRIGLNLLGCGVWFYPKQSHCSQWKPLLCLACWISDEKSENINLNWTHLWHLPRYPRGLEWCPTAPPTSTWGSAVPAYQPYHVFRGSPSSQVYPPVSSNVAGAGKSTSFIGVSIGKSPN